MPAKNFKLMSPRLQGVQILDPDCSRSVYQKWRRTVRDALEKAGSWGHCDGTSTCPMPMPAGRISLKEEPQPGLLEERRAWVKKDRDVKLDLFLSIHDEIKMDVFDVGPPLPPSALMAKEMLEELDERFAKIKFEDFHHVYCHFLNLHIDQFATLEEFNREYSSVLQEMEDFGYPLHNVQAISAYFSKLRCTQNPWVVKKLRDWEDIDPPMFSEVLAQAPPWIVIRPLACKTSSTNLSIHPPTPGDSDPEYMSEMLEDLAEEDEDLDFSSTSSSEQAEITIHASAEDLQISFPPPRNPRRTNTINTTITTASKTNLKTTPKTPRTPKTDRPLPPLPIETQAPVELDSTPTLEVPRIELPALPSPIELPATPLKSSTTPPPLPNHPLELPATPESFNTWPPAYSSITAQSSPTSEAWSLPLQGVPEISPISDEGSEKRRTWCRRLRPSPIKV